MLDKDGRDIKVGSIVRVDMEGVEIDGEVLNFLVATHLHPLESGAKEAAIVLLGNNERVEKTSEEITMTNQVADAQPGELPNAV